MEILEEDLKERIGWESFVHHFTRDLLSPKA